MIDRNVPIKKIKDKLNPSMIIPPKKDEKETLKLKAVLVNVDARFGASDASVTNLDCIVGRSAYAINPQINSKGMTSSL